VLVIHTCHGLRDVGKEVISNAASLNWRSILKAAKNCANSVNNWRIQICWQFI